MTSSTGGYSEDTRDRLTRLLQDGSKTVDELAAALGITLNAVRSQLTILERDGIIEVTGERRGLRRPARTYGLSSEGVRLLSRAYIPTLKAILKAMSSTKHVQEIENLLRVAGRNLADELGRPGGDLPARVAKALELLQGLGGKMQSEKLGKNLILRGKNCPLAEAVDVEPRTCKCMESFLSELLGAKVEEQCERGESKSCAFLITPSPGNS